MRSDQRTADAAEVADAAPDPILAVDDSGRIVYANPATCELLEREQVEGTGLDVILVLEGGHDAASLLSPDPQRLLAHVLTQAGQPLEVEISIRRSDTERGTRWVLVMHPLPRQELAMRELLRRATHDDLTPLANRSFLLERLDATFRDPRTADVPHALVMLDLDGFKQINDSWGHDAGDAVLVAVATRLSGLCRPADVVARLGGDEFAAWCRNVDDAHVPGLASRLAGAFNDPILFGDLELKVDGSVGATTTSFASDPNELLRQADAAMYRAKASGPGHQVIFDAHMAAELRERGTRERELRDALSNKQFVLHYQPVISLGTREVIGVEALARWQHPRLGELQPRDFLPLVESTLLGNEFDSSIIEQACHQLAEWQRRLSRPVTVWVNVSPGHLDQPLVDHIASLIESLELDPSHLVIELTEEASAATPERMAMLEAIHDLGARIAVDDFGTGHSQLWYLPELPIDLVKLDRSFVRGIAREPDRHPLASSLIGLAHALDAEVVAEGIESREDLELLEELGCDHAQGHLLARPRPPGDIPGIDLRDVIDLR
jgi:diguanylate cyclase (GGDEF)-like protein